MKKFESADNKMITGMPPETPEVPPAEKEAKILQQEFQEAADQEQKEGDPKFQIEIFYGAHRTAEDVEGFEKILARADIYIPEMIGHSEEVREIFNGVSEGGTSPEEALTKLEFGPRRFDFHFHRKHLEHSYNSHIPVTFIDVPDGHYLIEKINRNRDELKKNFSMLDFKGDLNALRHYFLQDVEIQRKREEYMRNSLRPRLQEILQKYPDLRKKKKIRVVLSLGIAHMPLVNELRRRGYQARSRPSRSLFVFNIGEEVEQRLFFHKEVSEDLMGQALFEQLFESSFGLIMLDYYHDASDVLRIQRKIAERFHLEDIRSIYKELSAGGRRAGFLALWGILKKKLAEKGITVDYSGKIRFEEEKNIQDEKHTK